MTSSAPVSNTSNPFRALEKERQPEEPKRASRSAAALTAPSAAARPLRCTRYRARAAGPCEIGLNAADHRHWLDRRVQRQQVAFRALPAERVDPGVAPHVAAV